MNNAAEDFNLNPITFQEVVNNYELHIKKLQEKINSLEPPPVAEINNITDKNFLPVLEENYKAAFRMVEEDCIRPSKEMVIETYEDLIEIYKNGSWRNQGINNIDEE